jgi:hypothetical protein
MIEDPSFYQETKFSINKVNNCNLLQNEDVNSDNIFNDSNYKMVIMVRDDLKMGKGKIAAQVGHGGK